LNAPPLVPFGLVLHRDGRLTHEGHPIRNVRLRERLERSVRYLPLVDKYVVQVGRFRGQIEVEEAAFFVREVDLSRGDARLSDGSTEALTLGSLYRSERDPDVLLCRVKFDLVAGGLPARFTHGAQAELLLAVEEGPSGPSIAFGGAVIPLPRTLGE